MNPAFFLRLLAVQVSVTYHMPFIRQFPYMHPIQSAMLLVICRNLKCPSAYIYGRTSCRTSTRPEDRLQGTSEFTAVEIVYDRMKSGREEDAEFSHVPDSDWNEVCGGEEPEDVADLEWKPAHQERADDDGQHL